MTIPAEQREAARCLERLTGCEVPLETHISAVFVGAERAFKLKKAVDLGFLDFTALGAREHFCRREMEINAPHAPEVYRGVRALTLGPGGAPRLGGAGKVIDWVVEMAPLPPGDFLDAVASRGGLDAALLDGLGDAVALLHARAEAHPELNPMTLIRPVVAGNFDAARAAELDPERVDALAAALRRALDRLAPALHRRAVDGWLRRCHGDLHLGNLVLIRGRPVPFDALEFDEAMATVDTGYDLAFLLMDLEVQLSRAAANRVLARYVARTGDAGLVEGLPFWLAMRALIRAHCENRAGRDGPRFLDAAEALCRPVPPVMVAVGGVMGTGKTRLARLLAPRLGRAPGALHLRSDEIRKRLAGVAPEDRLPPSAYDREAGQATHAELFRLAARAAAAGQAVVADAAFLDPAMRAGIEAAAREAGVPFVGLWLNGEAEVLAARIAARRGDASDADEAVMQRALKADPGALGGWTRIDAGNDPAPAALALLGAIVR